MRLVSLKNIAFDFHYPKYVEQADRSILQLYFYDWKDYLESKKI